MSAVVLPFRRPQAAFAEKASLADYTLERGVDGAPAALHLARLGTGELPDPALKTLFLDEARMEYGNLPPDQRDQIYYQGRPRKPVRFRHNHGRQILSTRIPLGQRGKDGFEPTSMFRVAVARNDHPPGSPPYRLQTKTSRPANKAA